MADETNDKKPKSTRSRTRKKSEDAEELAQTQRADAANTDGADLASLPQEPGFPGPTDEIPGPTPDIALWKLIKVRRIHFEKYRNFIDDLFCPPFDESGEPRANRVTPRHSLQRTDSYDGLKAATEQFLMLQCGFLFDVPILHAINLSGSDLEGTDREKFDKRLDIVHRRVAEPGRKIPTPEEIDRFLESYLQQIDGQHPDVKVLPYVATIRAKLSEMIREDCRTDWQWSRYAAACREHGLLCDRTLSPCMIELIWPYWMEQGMLAQTMTALSLRFQNRRSKRLPDPLANLTVDPLRPLNNLLWGFIQDETNRLSVSRRAFEYDHEYGLKISGRAVGKLDSVDSRSTFLESFHALLRLASEFYEDLDDKQKRADAFPVLNGLRDLHLVLAQGAHNQFGDLPWVARTEMMVMQYILARPEMREFLGNRVMVPHKEPWMSAVDGMKKLQGWGDTSSNQFHDLATTGEQLLLSVRYGNWNNVEEPAQAYHWALAWRPEIQRYVYAYRAVTGVDLLGDERDLDRPRVSTVQPSELIRRRMATQAKGA